MSEIESKHKEISQKLWGNYGKYFDGDYDYVNDSDFLDSIDRMYNLLEIMTSADHKVKMMKQIHHNFVSHDGRKTKTDYIWLTVNPDPAKLDPQCFFNVTNGFSHLKPVGAIIYVFEQRGTVKDDYHGIHLHALIKRNGKPTLIENAIHSNFDRFVGNPLDKHHIDIEYITLEECKSKFVYMKGQKKSAKMDKANNDPAFRTHYGLQTIYTRAPTSLVGGCAV